MNTNRHAEGGAPRQCSRKGSPDWNTETQSSNHVWAPFSHATPKAFLYLFPTINEVQDFSKGDRPLLADMRNAEQVALRDSVSVKRVRKAMLYLRGARATGKIEGVKGTSSRLKSVPVDRVVFDDPMKWKRP